MVAPVTENVTTKLMAPKVPAAAVPEVSTVTAAVLPNAMLQPAPAVASVPWLWKFPDSHAVDAVAADEMERKTILPSSLHGALAKLAVTV